MAAISTVRHDEVFDSTKHNPLITLIGAGAIGSRIFAGLVELGLTRITVYDYDVVEAHNLANQLYGTGDVGKSKVEALRDWYVWKTGTEPPDTMQFINEKVIEDTELKGTVILAVDSFKAREEIVRNNIVDSTDVFRFFDTRMASRHGHVMRVEHEHINAWLKTLGDDDQAETSACGSSLTVGATAQLIASLCVWQLMLYYIDRPAVEDRINLFVHPLVLGHEKFEEAA